MGYRLKYKPWHHKTPRREHRQNILWHNSTNIFLGQSPKTIEIKPKINKGDLVKCTSFCIAKETINKTRRQPIDWEKISANNAIDKGLISKIYKQFIQFDNKRNKQFNPKIGKRSK